MPEPDTAPAVRAAVVGVSESPTCGVRDHAILLSEALADQDVSCSVHWLSRKQQSLEGARREFDQWTGALAAELEANPPQAIILHYSVFSYSYRGVPLFTPRVLSILRARGIPLITFVHEPAYPWRLGGLRGKVWALTQRLVLMAVMRASAAALVTAPFRAEWLTSRWWLSRRPVALAPVFSNLPPPAADTHHPDAEIHRVGLFGYAYQGAARALVLDAMSALQRRGLYVRLELLGAPGSGVPAADAWLTEATARGLQGAVSFSGVLPAQELSNALAACEVLLHAEASGPTSRKGTLAASLASGRPVVAIDGPLRWQELIDSRAAVIAPPDATALADAIAVLLQDEHRREELGGGGLVFARQAMSAQRSAEALRRLLDRLLA
jgi:hypothetical protein